jgi:hypothetical protein
LEVWRLDGAVCGGIRDFINHIQVFNSDKPVSVFFDVCAVIDQGGCGGIGCGSVGLATLGESLYVKW